MPPPVSCRLHFVLRRAQSVNSSAWCRRGRVHEGGRAAVAWQAGRTRPRLQPRLRGRCGGAEDRHAGRPAAPGTAAPGGPVMPQSPRLAPPWVRSKELAPDPPCSMPSSCCRRPQSCTRQLGSPDRLLCHLRPRRPGRGGGAPMVGQLWRPHGHTAAGRSWSRGSCSDRPALRWRCL